MFFYQCTCTPTAREQLKTTINSVCQIGLNQESDLRSFFSLPISHHQSFWYTNPRFIVLGQQVLNKFPVLLHRNEKSPSLMLKCPKINCILAMHCEKLISQCTNRPSFMCTGKNVRCICILSETIGLYAEWYNMYNVCQQNYCTVILQSMNDILKCFFKNLN